MAYVPHSTLTGANLHYNMGDSRSATAWTLAAGTTDALLIENSNGNDLFSITTSTTPGLTTITIGNDTDTPQIECHSVTFQIVCPDDQTVFSIVAGGETPVRVESSSTTSHTLRLSNAWMRMAEVSGTPTFVAGSGFLYTRDDAGTTRCTFMRDDGSTVDLDNAGGGGTPGGSDTQVQYNNAGSFGGMANVEHLDGNLSLVADASPTAPAAGSAVVYAKNEASPHPAYAINGESPKLIGVPWASSNILIWQPKPSGDVVAVVGPGTSGTGTPLAPTPTSGTMADRALRHRMSSGSVINSGAGRFCAIQMIALETGFWLKFRIHLGAVNSDSYGFVGLTASNSSITGASPPSGFLNVIGFGKNDTDTEWQVMSNDGSGSTTTHVSLGSDFPINTTAIIDFVLYTPAGAATVEYWANRVDTAVTPVSGTISTDLPASTVFMTPRYYLNTGPTSTSVVQIELLSMVAHKEV